MSKTYFIPSKKFAERYNDISRENNSLIGKVKNYTLGERIKGLTAKGILTFCAATAVFPLSLVGCYQLDASEKPAIEQRKEEEIPKSGLLQENENSASLEWKVHFVEQINETYCPGDHLGEWHRFRWLTNDTFHCGGCKTRQVTQVKEEKYTAKSFEELTQQVYENLSNKNVEQKFFEANALLVDQSKGTTFGNDSARVNIASIKRNISGTEYCADSKAVVVETSKGIGVHVSSEIKKGKIEEKITSNSIENVILPENSTVDFLSDLARSVACEAGLATMEAMFEYTRGEEKISPLNPLGDAVKNVAFKTGENILERYSSEEIKAVIDLMNYAKTAEDFYDAISGKTSFIDISIAIKTFGLEQFLDYLEGKVLDPLDAQCEEIAEQVKKSYKTIFNSTVQRKQEEQSGLIKKIQNTQDLNNLPKVKDTVGGYTLNSSTSVEDWFRSRNLPHTFDKRKEVYEKTHPGETYKGTEEQNNKWVNELNMQHNNESGQNNSLDQSLERENNNHAHRETTNIDVKSEPQDKAGRTPSDNKVIDDLFHDKHPELNGRPLDPNNPADKPLIKEWVEDAKQYDNEKADTHTTSPNTSRETQKSEFRKLSEGRNPPGAPNIEREKRDAMRRDRERTINRENERRENERQNREQEQRARGRAARTNKPQAM